MNNSDSVSKPTELSDEQVCLTIYPGSYKDAYGNGIWWTDAMGNMKIVGKSWADIRSRQTAAERHPLEDCPHCDGIGCKACLPEKIVSRSSELGTVEAAGLPNPAAEGDRANIHVKCRHKYEERCDTYINAAGTHREYWMQCTKCGKVCESDAQ